MHAPRKMDSIFFLLSQALVYIHIHTERKRERDARAVFSSSQVCYERERGEGLVQGFFRRDR